MNICHYQSVNTKDIKEKFLDYNKHRCYLEIPFKNRSGSKTICVVGQNPSNANKIYADKTLHYIERYIYEKFTNVSKMIMLNLYSRVDTKKNETENLNKLECERIVRRIIKENDTFLIIFGQLKNQKKYKFPKKAELLFKSLEDKTIYKIDIGTTYAPHPGNSQIYYGNYCYKYTEYKLEL